MLSSSGVLILAVLLTAAQPVPAEYLTLEAQFAPATAARGERVALELRITMSPGWHIYGRKETYGRPSLAVADSKGLVAAGDFELPDGEEHVYSPEFKSYWLTGTAVLRQSYLVPRDAAPGTLALEGALEYTPCDKNTCMPPMSTRFEARLAISAAEPIAPAGDGGAAPRGGAGLFDETGGIWRFMLLAIGAGLFTLLMPCTYPMIPITVSFFTKQASDRGGSSLSLSLAYGVGIVAVFVLIGVALSGVIQPFAASPWTNLAIGVVFIIFAFALFGAIDLEPPQFLMNLAGKASTHGGYLGVFLMGAAFVVTSFTCTAPFVGSLLSVGTVSGGEQLSALARHGKIALGMGVFGLTMAAPFVLLSLLPAKLQSLPRSGEWMHTIKVYLGFVELAAALKFLSTAEMVWEFGVLPIELFLFLWAGLFGAAAAYLFGWIRLAGEPKEGIGPLQRCFATLTLFFALYCVYGALGHRLDWIMTAIIPNYRAGESIASSHIIVKDDYARALVLAREKKTTLLVNFTGFS